MFRRCLSLALVLQVLLLQLLQCRCPAHDCNGAKPHVHVPALAKEPDAGRHHGHCRHCHHKEDQPNAPRPPEQQGAPCDGKGLPGATDSVELPDGMHATRPSPAPFCLLWVALAAPARLVLAPPVLGPSNRPSPPGEPPSGSPLYLRLLTLLI